MGTIGRFVIVTKPTPYEGLVLASGSSVAAGFALKGAERDLSWYKAQHDRHMNSVAVVTNSLPKDISAVFVQADLVKTFAFRDNDVVIALGPDGLLANIAKYIRGGQMVITVDSDSMTNGGKLMKHQPKNVSSVVGSVLEGKPSIAKLPLVSARFENKDDEVLALNEILVGRMDQVSSRYAITEDNVRENQISSGVLIATGVGASGWISSIAYMMEACTGSCGKLANLPDQTTRELVYVVREPFVQSQTKADIVVGRISGNKNIVIESQMSTGGVVVSDGDVANFSVFPAGEKVYIGLSPITINLVV